MKSTEPKKESNGIVGSLILTLAPFAVMAVMRMRADQWKQLHMRVLLRTEKYCMNNARVWAHLADSAKSAYDTTRM